MSMTRGFQMANKYMLLGLLPVLILAVHAGATKTESSNCVRWHNGQCAECYYGWYGHGCQRKCTNCWTTGCYRQTGICEQCVPGRYGRHCNTDCPDNCRRGRDGRVNCDRDGGGCQEGCREGWWGDTCNNPCNVNCKRGVCLQPSGHCIGDCTRGWYGLGCDTPCHVGCLNNTCTSITGNCQDGCKPGYIGATCDNECDANCKDGECDISGRCVKGCIDGFRGNTCHDICPINCLLCEQDTGTCTQCKMRWTGDSCTVRTPETNWIALIPPAPSKESSIGVGCRPSSSNVLLPLVSLIVTLATNHHGFTLVPIFVNWRFQRPSISSVYPVQTS